MLENYLRPYFQRRIFDPLSTILCRYFSPNSLTFFSLLLGLCVPVLLFFHFIYWAIGLIGLSGVFDILDGSVARLSKKSSNFGTAFDIVSDRAVEFSIVFGLYFIVPQYTVLLFLILGVNLICVTSFLVVGIFVDNASNKGFFYSIGLMERFEAFVFFIAMILFSQEFVLLAWVYILLVLLTALIRLGQFRQLEKS